MKRLGMFLVVVAACHKGPSEEQCKQFFDHVVDLEFKKAGATADASPEMKAGLAKQKAAVNDAKSAEFMSACLDKSSRTRVECGIAAPDLDAIAKCDESP